MAIKISYCTGGDAHKWRLTDTKDLYKCRNCGKIMVMLGKNKLKIPKEIPSRAVL